MNFNYIFHTRNKGNTILAKLLENDIKTKDIWAAIIAHGVTNFLLGWYVIVFDAYQYW